MKRSHGQIIFESLWPTSKWEEMNERGKLSYERTAGILRRQILEELLIAAKDRELESHFSLLILHYELEKSK